MPNREVVCEKVVTGTREVTRQKAIAFEEETVTEEVIEYRCTEPLLKD